MLHVALPTVPRAVDGSNGGLTNLYLYRVESPVVNWLYANEYARSLIGCMQMSSYWGPELQWDKYSGINGRGGGALPY